MGFRMQRKIRYKAGMQSLPFDYSFSFGRGRDKNTSNHNKTPRKGHNLFESECCFAYNATRLQNILKEREHEREKERKENRFQPIPIRLSFLCHRTASLCKQRWWPFIHFQSFSLHDWLPTKHFNSCKQLMFQYKEKNKMFVWRNLAFSDF